MLLDMMDELKLVSCGQAAWLRAHVDFVTHVGGSVHADSHIDYILVSEASATSVRRFGIHANPDLCEDRGGRHATLFVEIDVAAVLGVAKPQQSAKAQGRFKSAVKYSDTPRLARFRDFSTKFFSKRGLDVAWSRSSAVSFLIRIYSGGRSLSAMKRSGVGGSRGIGDRQAQSAKGLRGVGRQMEARWSGLRTMGRRVSGAGHERANAAVVESARLHRAAVGPRSIATPELLISRQRTARCGG